MVNRILLWIGDALFGLGLGALIGKAITNPLLGIITVLCITIGINLMLWSLNK